jgi:hypothetical protein
MRKLETQSLTFDVDGEWCTQTAREWLYADKRPYDKVLDFLLACMDGTDTPKETLIEYADDILQGKRKLTGNTRDGSYGLTDDDVNIMRTYREYFYNKPAERRVVEMGGDVLDEVYSPAGVTLSDLEALSKRLNSGAAKLSKGFERWDYGWLRPDGKFFPSGWGEHERFAADYIEKNFRNADLVIYAGDFLIEKGWLLLHSPSNSGVRAWALNFSRSTKRQKEFLYDYFLERGGQDEANLVWEEEKNERH